MLAGQFEEGEGGGARFVLEFALAEAGLEELELAFHGGVVGRDAFLDDERSGLFLFLYRRGVLEGMAVFRNHALLLVSVYDCV